MSTLRSKVESLRVRSRALLAPTPLGQVETDLPFATAGYDPALVKEFIRVRNETCGDIQVITEGAVIPTLTCWRGVMLMFLKEESTHIIQIRNYGEAQLQAVVPPMVTDTAVDKEIRELQKQIGALANEAVKRLTEHAESVTHVINGWTKNLAEWSASYELMLQESDQKLKAEANAILRETAQKLIYTLSIAMISEYAILKTSRALVDITNQGVKRDLAMLRDTRVLLASALEGWQRTLDAQREGKGVLERLKDFFFGENVGSRVFTAVLAVGALAAVVVLGVAVVPALSRRWARRVEHGKRPPRRPLPAYEEDEAEPAL